MQEFISLEFCFINSKLSESDIIDIIFKAVREKDEGVSIVINPTLTAEVYQETKTKD